MTRIQSAENDAFSVKSEGGGEWQYVSKPTTETSTEAIIKFDHTGQMGLIAIIVGSQFSSDTHLADM